MHVQYAKEELLKTTEVATLSGVHVRTAIRWRRKLNVKCPTTWGTNITERPFKPTKPQPIKKIDDPAIWNDKEWFQEAYQKYGTRLIARMIGRSRQAVKLHLKKFKIPFRKAQRSQNKCCDPDWLDEQYNLNNKSIRECAKLAGVNNYTIYNWLVTFGFHIRDIHEALSGERNPNYGKNYFQKPINT